MDKNSSQLSRSLSLPEKEKSQGLLRAFQAGLQKTHQLIFKQLVYRFSSDKDFETGFLEPLYEKLILADVGVSTANKVIELLQTERSAGRLTDAAEGLKLVEGVFQKVFHGLTTDVAEKNPTVVFCIGVNGVGKTTTLGKLAFSLTKQGKKVLLVAADTFRAAAGEQLKVWADRAGAGFFQKEAGSDPASVIYESLTKAEQEGYDFVFCDTSGRLQNKQGLMDELSKMQRVAKKVLPEAPHYTWLVLDATTGQNAILQAKEFYTSHQVNGLIITKLDGTAKGGIALGIVNEFKIPIYYVGLGEKIEDLRVFSAEAYVQALLQEPEA